MYVIDTKANPERRNSYNHGASRAHFKQIPSVHFCLKVFTFLSKRLWRPFCLSLFVFGTLWGYYVLSQPDSIVVQKKQVSVSSNREANIYVSHDPKSNKRKADEIKLPHEQNIDEERSDGHRQNHLIQNEEVAKLSQKQNQKTDSSKSNTLLKRYPNYYEDGLRPNWAFKISKNYESHLLHQWTEAKRFLNDTHVSGPGENGTSFTPSKSEEELMNKLQKQHKYNLYASEKISLHRTLPDYRFPECKNLSYPDKLPTTSVIIVIHNEAWSALLRTVWSIIDRSPRELLEEIILVDDASTWDNLKRPLDDYVQMIPARIKVIRTEKREGLIRARLIGARNATGSVLTFLDAHMECSEGWLQPILSRIASDRSVVTVPIIDQVSSGDMSYRQAGFLVSGLRWHLIFNWLRIPQKEIIRTKNDKTAPVRLPTHVGCVFSIDREFFFEIGSYDEGMDIWGSENVELAVRLWLCGGALEMLPCSRVGHMYRLSTYTFNGDARKIVARNNKRLVEVWMDEFKEFFYFSNTHAKDVPAGNITDRINLRNRLKCKNFRWYLENIHPEMNWLRSYTMMGEMVNEANSKCLDIYTTALLGKLKTFPCHKQGGNQFFAIAENGQIFTVEQLCVGKQNQTVVLVECSENDESQLWTYNHDERQLVHKQSNFCMRINQTEVALDACNSTDASYKWNVVMAEPKDKFPDNVKFSVEKFKDTQHNPI